MIEAVPLVLVSDPARRFFDNGQRNQLCALRAHRRLLLLALLPVWLVTLSAAQPRNDYFKLTVVDKETGRGVPLVELRTTGGASYYTDSNGIVAFYEPGLMDSRVFFRVKSHGYECAEKFFDERGKILQVVRGGSAVVQIKRLNLAERLYRVTGEGIYRDSLLTGHPVPTCRIASGAQSCGPPRQAF